jgi:phosphoacetylglucosamine mutase
MITASHNPSEDNGVKLIDPKGEMLESAWVRLASDFLNVPDEGVAEWLDTVARTHVSDDVRNSSSCDKLVFIGQDTRDSSPRLAEAAEHGVRAMNGKLVQHGLLTTPQLHFIVNQYNQAPNQARPTETTYYNQLADAFNALCKDVPTGSRYRPHVVIDCANGVGAPKFAQLYELIRSSLTVDLVNTGDGRLNHLCGADYVKLDQKAPESLQIKANVRYASFDGDADRVVFFYARPNDEAFVLIDGDKIAVLSAIYLQQLLREADLADQLTVSVVQTAYANGRSTDYLENTLKVQVHCVATGILNLHEKASESDLGVYFEANGHGTVLFSDKAQALFAKVEDKRIRSQLDAFIRLINQVRNKFDAF